MATPQTSDWACLPLDLLETIAAHLTEIVDRVRFSSVCSQWRSASKSIAADLPRQLPWLLLPSDYADASTATRRFFSLSRNRIFALPLADFRDNQFFPSPYGWILAPRDAKTLEFRNPLTGSSTPLPPLPSTASRWMNKKGFVPRKVKVFDTNLVAVLFPSGSDLLFCRLGDDLWRWLDVTRYCCSISDFAFHNGRLFVIDGAVGSIRIFDMDTLKAVDEIPRVQGYVASWGYLVESSAGELLLVRRIRAQLSTRFRLFQLEEKGGEAKWMEVSDIGDDVLFVDDVEAMAFPATDLNGRCRRNHIYFAEWNTCRPGWNEKGVMMFDIAKARTDQNMLFTFMARDYRGKVTWAVPSLC